MATTMTTDTEAGFQPDPAPQELNATISLDPEQSTGAESPSPDGSLERLVNAVLDSAGVANRSATVAATSTENMLNALGDLDRVTAAIRRQGYVLLGLSLGSVVATVAALALASMTLNSRVSRADATLLAVGKRVVELNAGVENMKRIESMLANADSSAMEAMQSRLEQKLESSVADIRKAVTATPERVTKQDDQRIQATLTSLGSQLRSLEIQNQAQVKAITRLTEQLGAARSDVATLARITSQLENQLQLERTKVAAQATPPTARPRERRDDPRGADFIQYPDPQLKKLESRQ